MATERTQVILPTAINVVTAVNEVLITRKKEGLATEIDLPSLRRRALLIVKEAGALSVKMVVNSTETDFNR